MAARDRRSDADAPDDEPTTVYSGDEGDGLVLTTNPEPAAPEEPTGGEDLVTGVRRPVPEVAPRPLPKPKASLTVPVDWDDLNDGPTIARDGSSFLVEEQERERPAAPPPAAVVDARPEPEVVAAPAQKDKAAMAWGVIATAIALLLLIVAIATLLLLK